MIDKEERRVCKELHLCLFSSKQRIEMHSTLDGCKKEYPEVEAALHSSGAIFSLFFCSSQEKAILQVVEKVKEFFSSFIFSESSCKIEEAIHQFFLNSKKSVAFGESCTGGSLSVRLVSLPGASKYFLGSIIAYADSLKQKLLCVSSNTLQTEGAVSSKTVEEMVKGVFAATEADYAVAISGFAGPEGGTLHSPLGTIWVSVGEKGKKPDVGSFFLKGERTEILHQATQYALFCLWLKAARQINPFELGER